jgi:hypothetical protein
MVMFMLLFTLKCILLEHENGHGHGNKPGNRRRHGQLKIQSQISDICNTCIGKTITLKSNIIELSIVQSDIGSSENQEFTPISFITGNEYPTTTALVSKSPFCQAVKVAPTGLKRQRNFL